MRSAKGFRKLSIQSPKLRMTKIPTPELPKPKTIRSPRNITGKMVKSGKIPKIKKIGY